MNQIITLDDKHIYHMGDIILPGVTEILNLVGYTDFSKIPLDVLEAAKKIGNEVHSITQKHDENTLKPELLDEPIIPYFKGWTNFIEDFDVKMLSIEEIVHSLKWGYAGKIDRLGTIRGELALIDIKTVSTVTWACYVQTMGGYAIAVEEVKGCKIKVKNHVIVQLGPKFPRGYKTHTRETLGQIARDKSDFLAAVQVIKARIRNKLIQEEIGYAREIIGG